MMKKVIISKKHIPIFIILGLILFLALGFFFIRRYNSFDLNIKENIVITSSAFEDGGTIPKKYTGQGEDISPDFLLSSVSPEAKSIAIIMDDLDFPMGVYNHWVIWNIPVMEQIPAAIPHGEKVEALNNAIQGIGYGKHKYKGPNPPFGSHRYQYKIYVLDTLLDMESDSGKRDLLKKMEGHVLQYGSITGKFK